MKQSYGRLLAARLMSPAAAVGMAAAAVAAFAACHNNSNTPCPNLSQATVVLGQTSFVTNTPQTSVSASTMSSPESVAYNPSNGYFYVADTFNNRILGYKSVPTTIGAAADFVLGQPCLEVSTAGTAASTSIPTACSSDGTAALNAYGLAHPSKVWIDQSSPYEMAIADTSNNRVLIFSSGAPTDSTTAPSVILGQTSISGNSPNQSLTTVNASTLKTPTSAVVVNGQIAVADQGNNRVLIWSSIPTSDGADASDELGQLSVTSAGLDCTTSTTEVYSGGTGYCFASNSAGQGDQYVAATATYQVVFNAPTDLWSDGGELFVSDSGDNRVIYYSSFPTATAGTSLSPYNQQPNYLLGQSKFNNITSASGASGLYAPGGISSDGSSNLFIADTNNNRILQIIQPINTFGQAAQYVFGQEDFAHTAYNDPDQNNEPGDQRNNPPTLNPVDGTLYQPYGVLANDTLGLLFIADTQNNRVLIYPESNGENGTYPNLCS